MAFTDALANAPRPQKIAGGIVGLVIVAALGYFIVSPKSTERDVLRQRNEALQAEVAKARVEEAGLRTFRAQADALRKRLDLAKGRLPSEREIPGLYRQISDLALQAGLAVALFAPKPAEDKDNVDRDPDHGERRGHLPSARGLLLPDRAHSPDRESRRLSPRRRRASDRHLAGGADAGHLSVPARGLATARRHPRRPSAGVPSATRPPDPRSHTMTAERVGRASPDSEITRGGLARPHGLGDRLRRRRAAESTAGRGSAHARGGRDGDGSGQAGPCGAAQGARAGTALAAAFVRRQGAAGSLRAHRRSPKTSRRGCRSRRSSSRE